MTGGRVYLFVESVSCFYFLSVVVQYDNAEVGCQISFVAEERYVVYGFGGGDGSVFYVGKIMSLFGVHIDEIDIAVVVNDNQ